MTEIIKFEDWVKLKLKVGEARKNGDKIVIKLDGKSYEVNLDLDVKKGDKIVVGLNGDGLVIPVIEGRIPLDAGKDSKEGWRVS
ncbi:MAG TPA: hypothetical protein VJH92_06435 [Candidatus Nanoarchaeia archaeon]|nr:hypothetical protein [Candidatus Nanoarchaeia archaeon]